MLLIVAISSTSFFFSSGNMNGVTVVYMFRAVPGFRPYRYGPGRSRIAQAVAELQGRSGMAYISLRAYVI